MQWIQRFVKKIWLLTINVNQCIIILISENQLIMSKFKKNVIKKKWEDPKLIPLNLSDTQSGAATSVPERTSTAHPLGTPFAAS